MPQESAADPGGTSPSEPSHDRPPRQPGRWAGVALVIAGLALIAGGIYTAYLGAAGRGPATRINVPSPTTPPPGTDEPKSESAPAGSIPPGATAPASLVRVAPALVGQPDVGSVVQVLTTYFTAINERDHDGYLAVLTNIDGRLDTPEKFREAFRSTHDSQMRLVGLARPDGGEIAATVTFRSTQDPRDSPDGESDCLNWVVTFPMVSAGDGFRIDVVRPFRTIHRPC